MVPIAGLGATHPSFSNSATDRCESCDKVLVAPTWRGPYQRGHSASLWFSEKLGLANHVEKISCTGRRYRPGDAAFPTQLGGGMVVQIDPSRMARRRRRHNALSGAQGPPSRTPGRRAFRVHPGGGESAVVRKIARIMQHMLSSLCGQRSTVPPPKFLEVLYW